MTTDAALESWSLDRETVLACVIDAPRERLFEAWTDAQQLARWFGPDGFTVENSTADIRVGGSWRFDLVAPDGTRYDNRVVYLDLTAPVRLVFDHGPDRDEASERFRMTLTFDEQQDGKTVVTLRQLHPTKEQRDATVAFGAVELGYQTLGKLAEYVGGA